MKVLHVASGDLWAGAEAMLQSLCEAQARISDVAVAAVVLNEGRLARELRAITGEVAVLPESELGLAGLGRRLSSKLRQFKPQVVHTHRIKEDILGSLAASLYGHARCVRTVHGVDEGADTRSRLRARALSTLHGVCVRRLFDMTFVVSEEMLGPMGQEFGHARVKYIANGIEVDRVRNAVGMHASRSADPRIHVGIIGRLVTVKRVDLFLRMAALLQARHPGRFRFSIYGDGPQREELERLAASLELSDARFHGFVASLAPELAQLDVLCITSDSEGLPMVALEAMALRVPIVARAVGQLPKLLDNGRCGRLIVEQDPGAYAEAVAAFLAEPDEFSARASRAEARVVQCYSADACASAYVKAYSTL